MTSIPLDRLKYIGNGLPGVQLKISCRKLIYKARLFPDPADASKSNTSFWLFESKKLNITVSKFIDFLISWYFKGSKFEVYNSIFKSIAS